MKSKIQKLVNVLTDLNVNFVTQNDNRIVIPIPLDSVKWSIYENLFDYRMDEIINNEDTRSIDDEMLITIEDNGKGLDFLGVTFNSFEED